MGRKRWRYLQGAAAPETEEGGPLNPFTRGAPPVAVARVPLLGLAGRERSRLDEKGQHWSIGAGSGDGLVGDWGIGLGGSSGLAVDPVSRASCVGLGRYSLLFVVRPDEKKGKKLSKSFDSPDHE